MLFFWNEYIEKEAIVLLKKNLEDWTQTTQCAQESQFSHNRENAQGTEPLPHWLLHRKSLSENYILNT